jgi:hypothetical protein
LCCYLRQVIEEREAAFVALDAALDAAAESVVHGNRTGELLGILNTRIE